MKYTIVKHADENLWHLYYEENPIQSGVNISHSAHDTYTGRSANIKKYYDDIIEAEADCKKINQLNPSGLYGVCKVITIKDNINEQ